jgi:hypothetical protein
VAHDLGRPIEILAARCTDQPAGGFPSMSLRFFNDACGTT